MYCEFLDTEWYESERFIRQPGYMKDPWKSNKQYKDIFLVPRIFLETITQKKQYNYCLITDQEKVFEVKRDINENGLRNPLEIVVDSGGSIVLRDGHHRLLATDGIDHFIYLPCFMTQSENIRASGARQLMDCLTEMFR